MPSKSSSLRKSGDHPVNAKQAKSELARLAKEIAYHDRLYHQKDDPEISDAEYDALRARYRDVHEAYPGLAPKDDPEKRVGAAPAAGFSKLQHAVPMLSLNNAFSDDDVKEFASRIRRFLQLSSAEPLAFMAEPKIDGLSASLRYEEGKLVSAATRGDGSMGENITANVRTIKSVPHQLNHPFPEVVEVRGEIYLNRDDFTSLNARRQEIGEPLFANPRNAAAGSVRQLDQKVTASRPLRFFAYALGETTTAPFATQKELRAQIKKWGFTLNEPVQLCETAEELLDYYHRIENGRHALPFDIDGVVYKLDHIPWQDRLGFVSRAPRWAIAHKFAPEQASTRLKKILIQVGRTGALTPVAELEPVTVGGVVVSRATLHNEDEIARKDIREGDVVTLQRAGDVIPQVTGVDLKQRAKGSATYVFPDRCPECGSLAVREEGMAVRRCEGGLFCPAQALERLRHFTSRDAFNIEGLGDQRLRELSADKLIRSPADIFRLKAHKTELTKREGWGSKSTEKLLAAIEERRTIPLEKFIYALGIRQVGEVTAKLLARHYLSFEVWTKAMTAAAKGSDEALKDLDNIEQIGPLVARDILAFFSEKHNIAIVADLGSELDIRPFVAARVKTDSPFAGKSIVFTGTLTAMGRAEAKAQAEAHGANVGSAVSSKTNYLIIGEDAGSKATKAKELGVVILTEDEWIKMLK